jgi:hypothetical protein
MHEAKIQGAAEAFDIVLLFNKRKFLHLLELLEPLQGDMITRLRQMALFQLEALVHCIGRRRF